MLSFHCRPTNAHTRATRNQPGSVRGHRREAGGSDEAAMPICLLVGIRALRRCQWPRPTGATLPQACAIRCQAPTAPHHHTIQRSEVTNQPQRNYMRNHLSPFAGESKLSTLCQCHHQPNPSKPRLRALQPWPLLAWQTAKQSSIHANTSLRAPHASCCSPPAAATPRAPGCCCSCNRCCCSRCCDEFTRGG